MKLEEQITNLILSERLKALGVPQKGIFKWVSNDNRATFHIWPNPKLYAGDCIAFTVAELGKLLPKFILEEKKRLRFGWAIIEPYCYAERKLLSKEHIWRTSYQLPDENYENINFFEAKTEADSRALCLIWLIENDFWEPIHE